MLAAGRGGPVARLARSHLWARHGPKGYQKHTGGSRARVVQMYGGRGAFRLCKRRPWRSWHHPPRGRTLTVC